MHPGSCAYKACLSSEIRRLILNTATYEKPGAYYASVSALKGYKESFVFQIITRKNSPEVKYARAILCCALSLLILAARKENQKGAILALPNISKLFFETGK